MAENNIPSSPPDYFLYAPDPLCFLDREGNIGLLNPAWFQLTGYTETELLHHPFSEYLHPEDRVLIWNVFEQVRDGAPAASIDARFISKDQTILFFSWRFLTLGRPGTIFVVVQDLTLLKNAERELSESRERYKFLADCATEGLVLSENGIILEANSAMTRMSGFFPEEIIGQNVLKFVPAQDHEKVKAGILKETEGFYEILGVRSNGRTFPMEIAGRFMTYQGRRVRVTLLRDISDRKKLVEMARREADRVLRDQADLFHALTENTLEVVVVLNPDATVRFTGAGNPRLLGYGPEENVGRSAFELVHPEDLVALKEVFADLAKSPGTTRTMEVRIQHKDGSWRPMEITGHNLFNEHAVKGMVLNLRDVSERRKAQERLVESERFHRAILENALDVVIVHDAQGVIQYLSPSTEWVLGHKTEQNIGKSIFDEIHPDDAGLVMETMKQMVSDASPKMFLEMRVRHRNGQWRNVELVTQNLLEDPAVRGFVVNLRDITERKIAGNALRESESRLRSLFDAVDQIVLLMDQAGRLQSFNKNAQREFLRLYGRELKLGDSFLDTLKEPESVTLRITHQKALRGESRVSEISLGAFDGQSHWYEYGLYPVKDDAGQVTGTCFTALCIDARKDVEERTLHVERLAAIGQVTGAIAHEMRNPLSVISALSQEKADTGDADGARLTAQTAKLTRLMDDILEFSRRTNLKMSELEPNNLVQTALVSARTQAGEAAAPVAVHWEGDWTGVRFVGDRDRLEQVFHNLLLNAYQSLGNKGSLTLSCRREGAELRLDVRDDGPGLGEKDLSRMFEPFYTTKKLGTGLGLAISRKIIEDHGGSLTASRGQPQGMVFTVRLPLAPRP